jgi:glycine/D-amino acid oxidase-like deaminating enzyme
MADLPGKDTSLWLATTPETDFPPLQSDNEIYDVLIAGGGIAGILTAWELQQAGQKVALLDKDGIVQNTTGNTTAKLSSQHNLVYDFLIEKHGKEVAKAFGDANQQAIADIKDLADKLKIDCDYEPADAYVITEDPDEVERIKAEVKAAKSLGLPASFETQTDSNFDVQGAIKFSDQAQFHPRKFLLGVAARLRQHGVPIYEQTEASDITPGDIATVKTNKGEIRANKVVVATKYPFWKRDIFDDVAWVKLSYALGILLDEDYPMGMYITSSGPIRTLRSHPYKDSRILVFGGESHKMTKDYNKDEHYQALVEDVQNRFKVKEIIYRWVAGDMMPHDRLPYIGAYPGEKNIFVITGFHAWGLAWGMAAAQMIRDEILGQQHPNKEFFNPSRLNKKS